MDFFNLIANGLKILGAAILLYFVSHYFSTRLPRAGNILAATLEAPIQENLEKAAAFDRQIGNHSYHIQPKANYTLRGLVVELHDSASVFDITHRQAGDLLNSHDLCVIWGDDAQSPYLKDIHFSHGDWTCYYETKSSEAWKNFRQNQVSNNHILPSDEQVYKVIRSARIGDQIEIHGQLVNYTTDDGPPRQSSMTREDTGDGACEIIYATSAQIVSRSSEIWYLLEKFARLMMIIGGMMILFSMGRSYARSGDSQDI